MKQKLEKLVMAKEALKAMQELEDSVRLEDIVKDNKIEFKSGENTFRVRKPVLEEQQEIDNARRKKYLELVRDNSYLFKKQWVETYKKKGIDINKIETDIKRIEDEIRRLLIRLAKTTDKKGIGELKNQILKSRDEQYALSIEQTDLLSYSIEDQTFIYAKSYTAYLILERLDKKKTTDEHVVVNDNKWVKHFKDFEEFQKSEDSDLVSKLFYYFDVLIYSEPK